MISSSAFTENAILFVHMLRRAGISTSVEQTINFNEALSLIDIGDREQVYYAARCMLVKRHEDLRLFETLFNRFWRGIHPGGRPKAPRQRRTTTQAGLANLLTTSVRKNAEQIEAPDDRKVYSDLDVLQSKNFARMTPEELDAVRQLIQRMRWRVSQRESRRRVSGNRGDMLDFRRVMRSTVRHSGVPMNLYWRSRKIKQRPVVLIADISGSMENYSRLLLQFFHSVFHTLKQVECFVFGSRLTRITPQLRVKNIDLALEEAALEVADWSGGTRIGESLRTFNQQWSKRVLGRGAIVLIVSDGWERGTADLLKQEMRFLARRSHRLIWLNPLMGDERYEPLVEGMAAALPYVDHFLPCHNLRSLETFGEVLESLD
jgi:uncharacterized protein with von Willebrand factor type A (vWA) domain